MRLETLILIAIAGITFLAAAWSMNRKKKNGGDKGEDQTN